MKRTVEETYREYDPFAWLYEQGWGTQFHRQALPALDRLLDGLRPEARILDLCCGTGVAARYLAAKGFQVTGLDGSREMLRFARERLPSAEFVLADARRFRLAQPFGAAVSLFDSLNHILTAQELFDVFQHVFESLVEGGRFVFDLNREIAYRKLWVLPVAIVEADHAAVARGSYDSEARIARCDVTLFRLSAGEWRRSDFSLHQRFHPNTEVRRALAAAGFSRVRTFDAARDLKMKGDAGFGRTFYQAVK